MLISAHGGYYHKKNESKMFEVKEGTTMFFYNPHDTVLKAPGVKRVFNLTEEPKETVEGPTACYDCQLSKHQGTHGGKPGKPAETYESIEKQGEKIHKYHGCQFRNDYNQMKNKIDSDTQLTAGVIRFWQSFIPRALRTIDADPRRGMLVEVREPVADVIR